MAKVTFNSTYKLKLKPNERLALMRLLDKSLYCNPLQMYDSDIEYLKSIRDALRED